MVGPTIDNPVPDPLVVLNIDNRLYLSFIFDTFVILRQYSRRPLLQGTVLQFENIIHFTYRQLIFVFLIRVFVTQTKLITVNLKNLFNKVEALL